MAIRTLRGVSALALLVGAGGASTAIAQQAPTSGPAPDQTVTTAQAAQNAQGPSTADQTAPQPGTPAADRVIITGSLIATTPEDSPKPVEVYSAQDLEQQGTPNVTEFIRSLSISYGDDLGFGQASPDVPEGTGFGNANLRGLGSNATLALMNGKPLAPWNGSFGADINTVPMGALQAVEVLKGGASATYGAGAVAGVINFKTRRDIDAPQISIEKQSYEGSDGYYKVDFLTGWTGDAGNFLVSLSHSHEDEMLMTEREFSSLPFAINPPGWTITGSNPGQFQPTTANFYVTPAGTGTVAAGTGINDYRTAADCTALGGQRLADLRPNDTSTLCAVPQAPFQSLVNDNTMNQAYAEFNADISDSMEVHFDVNWSSSNTREARLPIDAASVQAIDRSNTITGVRAGMSGCATTCNYVVPMRIQTYTGATIPSPVSPLAQPPGTPTGTFYRNPFIDDFLTRTGVTTCTTAVAGCVLPADAALYMGGAWRPFMFGGNPMFEDGRRRNQFERDSFTINAGINGEFAENTWVGPWLNGIHYDFSGQYNQYMNTYHQGDIFASRLQNAMLGYGGPQCNAIDRVPTDYTSASSYNRTVGVQSNTAPGTNGCQWFNPFASGFATSVINGAANPQFNAGAPLLAAGSTARPTGYANPKDLIDWMWGDKVAEFQLQSVTFDGKLSGTIPENLFTLPGGDIGWAVGTQWRQVEGRRSNLEGNDAEETMNTQNCVWPDRAVANFPAQQEPGAGTPGCTTLGAFHGTGRLTIVGATVPPWYYDNQNISVFTELQFPILDNVSIQYSGRHEEWNGGALKGDIYSIAGKWDITDNLWIRSDYGTNYRADNALELDPGSVVYNSVTQNRFGNGFLVTESTTVASNITPEDDRTFDFGIGWESDLGEGRIRASVNFFEIFIDKAVTTTTAATIYNDVFGTNTATGLFDPDDRTGQGGVDGPLEPSVSSAGSVTPPTQTFQYANCDAPLAAFVLFSTPCTTLTANGVTTRYNTSNNILEAQRVQQNGPGFITNGIDYSIDYVHPLFDGTFSAQVTATQNLVYKAHGYTVNGIVFDSGGQRLGRANYTSTGNESREWRANGQVRWANDVHNVSLRANYSSGVYNEAYDIGALTAIINNNPATTANETTLSTYGIKAKSYLDFDVNYIYTAPFWQDLEFRATVLNIFDKAPSAAQGRSGYYNATGNPRGRIIEVGVTKKF